MKKSFLLVLIILLAACNDETDVVVVTGSFKHTAQFEERGLSMTVIHLDDVVNALNDNDVPATRKKVAQNHMSAINNMAAGTVILNFGGGYAPAVSALNKYSGRKIYCAGIEHWQVGVPDGCIGISSVYSKLDELAPISYVEWNASQPSLPLPDIFSLTNIVYIRDKSLLGRGRELLESEHNFMVVDATNTTERNVEGICTYFSPDYFCQRSDGYMISQYDPGSEAGYFYSLLAQYYLDGVGDLCEPVAWAVANAGPDYGGSLFADYPDLLIDTSKGKCWVGPTDPENGWPVAPV